MRRPAETIVFLSLLLFFSGAGLPRDREDLKRTKLSEPTEFQGVMCQRHTWTRENGDLHSCTLAEDTSFGKADLPAGAFITLDDDGRPRFSFLPRDMRIQGHLCRGGGHSFSTGFHPSGALRTCWLAEPEEVEGIPCARVSGWEFFRALFGMPNGSTVFHENGRLARCLASRPVEIAGRQFGKGAVI
jgi:hypothetical protein